MARRRLPTHITVPVHCYDDAAPEGTRAIGSVLVPTSNPYKVPAADRDWLLAEIGYGDAERDAGAYEPTLMIFAREVDAELRSAGYKI